MIGVFGILKELYGWRWIIKIIYNYEVQIAFGSNSRGYFFVKKKEILSVRELLIFLGQQ